MSRHRPSRFRLTFAGITAAVIFSTVTGCSDGISEADVAFVSAETPSQFESLRMYSAAPPSGNAHLPGRLHQGCMAIIRSQGRDVRETVILEDDPGASFDLDVARTFSGWHVTSDGLAPPSADSIAFRTQFTNCVSAVQDKYAAEPEKAPFE